MNIGCVKVDPPLALAPMAGYTDYAFRKICRLAGAALVVSEMVSSRGIYYKDKKTKELLKFTDEMRPFAVQLFGSEPSVMEYAAAYICGEYNPDIIDINMGCPTPKIVSCGDGSRLMADEVLAGMIVSAAVRGAGATPVSVKLRAGIDDGRKNAVDIAGIAEACGAKAVFVHGRTAAQMYKPPVDYDVIRRVKENVRIPVFANGNITSGNAAQVMCQTGADGLMIGRAALGNPCVFNEICRQLFPEACRPEELSNLELAFLQLEEIVKDKGEKRGIIEARGQLLHYIRNIPDSARLRAEMTSASTYGEMKSILMSIAERRGG